MFNLNHNSLMGSVLKWDLNEVKNTCLFHLLQLIEDVINIIYKISVKLDNITMSL